PRHRHRVENHRAQPVGDVLQLSIDELVDGHRRWPRGMLLCRTGDGLGAHYAHRAPPIGQYSARLDALRRVTARIARIGLITYCERGARADNLFAWPINPSGGCFPARFSRWP